MTITMVRPQVSAVAYGNAGMTPCAGSALLSVTGLCVDYGPWRAVSDASLVLHRGEVLGLAGPPGSGKSTLACAIAGLLRPPAVLVRGRVMWHPETVASAVPWLRQESADGPASGVVDGRIAFDVLAAADPERRGLRRDPLGVVLSGAALAPNPLMTIQAQLTAVLRKHRPWWTGAERRARAGQLLELTGIPVGQMNSLPHQQPERLRLRLGIALALALDPQVLVLDEAPNPAVHAAAAIPEMLGELLDVRDGLDLAVVVTSRDRARLAGVADVVAVMDAGRIVETADLSAAALSLQA